MPGLDRMPVSLLTRLVVELGGGGRSWSDLVLVRNTGPLVTKRPLTGDRISNRGFNAVLLSREGDPSHYVKVRPASHEQFRREVQIHTKLSSHPATRSVVSPASTFVLGPMRVLATEFIQGTRLNALLRGESSRGGCIRLLGAAAGAARPVWEVLGGMGDKGTAGGGSLIRARFPADLAVLLNLGLTKKVGGFLEEYVLGGALPSVPQHGDLWPRNLFKVRGGWRVLDFETSGEIDLPLYDVFHLVRGSAGPAGIQGTGAWLRWWAEAGVEASRLRQAIAGQLRNLGPEDAGVALTCYLTNVVARLGRRGISPQWITPWLRELEFLPSILSEGLVQKAVWGESLPPLIPPMIYEFGKGS